MNYEEIAKNYAALIEFLNSRIGYLETQLKRTIFEAGEDREYLRAELAAVKKDLKKCSDEGQFQYRASQEKIKELKQKIAKMRNKSL